MSTSKKYSNRAGSKSARQVVGPRQHQLRLAVFRSYLVRILSYPKKRSGKIRLGVKPGQNTVDTAPVDLSHITQPSVSAGTCLAHGRRRWTRQTVLISDERRQP